MDPVQSNWGIKKFLVIILTLVSLMFVWQWISTPMVVTVSGSGEVSVPATSATVSFTLSTTSDSPGGAITAVKQKADTMQTFLATKGISPEDVAESQVTAVPAGLVTQGASGFQATISMAAKTVHVSDVSSLVSDLYTNGASVVSQPILTVEKEDELEEEALNMALKDAKTEAGKLALKNWKFIRKIVSINQISSPTTSTATTKADTLTSANNQVALENGVFKIVKAVSVSYKMW